MTGYLRRMGPWPGIPILESQTYAGPMPILCGNAGPLPESMRSFLDEKGDLRCGDAVGLEARWCLSEVTIIDPHENYVPEDDYGAEERREARSGDSCVTCGSVTETVDGECAACGNWGNELVVIEPVPSGWIGWSTDDQQA